MTSATIKKKSWVCLIAPLLVFASSASAEDMQSTTQSLDTNKNNSQLKGSVKGVALLTQDGLVKIGETAKSAQSAGMQLINELNRKEITPVRSPNVIGAGIVIPAAPNVTGTIALGDLAPREKFVARFFNQVAYHVQLLRNEVSALILPDEPSEELKSYWSQIQAESEQMQNHVNSLRNYVSSTPYDSNRASKEALGIYDESLVVNKLRKQVQKILKP